MEGERGGPGVGAPRPEPWPAGRRFGSRATLITLIAIPGKIVTWQAHPAACRPY